MFYYRSPGADQPITLQRARLTTGLALVLYPVGALLPVVAGSITAARLIGLCLIAIAFACALLMGKTTLQRIVGEEASRLDEYELKLRARATSMVYQILSALVLAGVFYLAVATDAGWWYPKSYEEFNGLFWGIFLYCFMLPGFILAWQAEATDLGPQD
ncbi:MAG: hypothetical protein ACKOQ3_05695 [Novosphingobium sp.]